MPETTTLQTIENNDPTLKAKRVMSVGPSRSEKSDLFLKDLTKVLNATLKHYYVGNKAALENATKQILAHVELALTMGEVSQWSAPQLIKAVTLLDNSIKDLNNANHMIKESVKQALTSAGIKIESNETPISFNPHKNKS